jgi:hypothetical protein
MLSRARNASLRAHHAYPCKITLSSIVVPLRERGGWQHLPAGWQTLFPRRALVGRPSARVNSSGEAPAEKREANHRNLGGAFDCNHLAVIGTRLRVPPERYPGIGRS